MTSGTLHGWFYVIKYAMYFGLAWGAVFVRRWLKGRRETAAQSWPSVDGLIVSGKVSPIPKTTLYVAELQYTYFLEEYRAGKYTHEFKREAEADDFVRQMKDKRVQIRYNSTKPDKSVLEQSVVEQHVLLAPRMG